MAVTSRRPRAAASSLPCLTWTASTHTAITPLESARSAAASPAACSCSAASSASSSGSAAAAPPLAPPATAVCSCALSDRSTMSWSAWTRRSMSTQARLTLPTAAMKSSGPSGMTLSKAPPARASPPPAASSPPPPLPSATARAASVTSASNIAGRPERKRPWKASIAVSRRRARSSDARSGSTSETRSESSPTVADAGAEKSCSTKPPPLLPPPPPAAARGGRGAVVPAPLPVSPFPPTHR